MLKLTGAICVLLGAAWWGLGAVGQLRERTRTLERLRSALSYLEEELSFRLTPLPALLERLSQWEEGRVSRFFQETLEGLRADPEGGVRQSWRRAMVRQLSILREEERQILLDVGETLGRYDAQAQRQIIRQAAERLEEERRRSSQEERRLGRVYAALSLAGGAAVILVLV